ncbi:hypothetical protein XENOCAPTIV_007215 [Xenoophorus captivus]|uniref:Uncharacterized protein n=1 Tax=Xenoophorus captivus TaxID=1517983 RepID=A0ABV0QV31_9TELE
MPEHYKIRPCVFLFSGRLAERTRRQRLPGLWRHPLHLGAAPNQPAYPHLPSSPACSGCELSVSQLLAWAEHETVTQFFNNTAHDLFMSCFPQTSSIDINNRILPRPYFFDDSEDSDDEIPAPWAHSSSQNQSWYGSETAPLLFANNPADQNHQHHSFYSTPQN